MAEAAPGHIDPATHDGVATQVTVLEVTDAEVFPELLEQLEDQPIATVAADGAYDQRSCYDAVEQRGGQGAHPASGERARMGGRPSPNGSGSSVPYRRPKGLEGVGGLPSTQPLGNGHVPNQATHLPRLFLSPLRQPGRRGLCGSGGLELHEYPWVSPSEVSPAQSMASIPSYRR